MSITLESPVCDIATEYPQSITVFERLGIEYCCHGTHTLSEACAKKSLDGIDVLAAIEAQNPDHGNPLGQNGNLGDLCAHITQRHHAYELQQLALIHKLLVKTQRRHGVAHPELFFIGELVFSMEAELKHHFQCEEDMLFPYIAKLEEDPCAPPPAMFQNISQPLRRMSVEHDHTSEQLKLLREKTKNYEPPADACTTFVALWKALEDLEKDMHLHLHLENDVLFPRASALAEQTS